MRFAAAANDPDEYIAQAGPQYELLCAVVELAKRDARSLADVKMCGRGERAALYNDAVDFMQIFHRADFWQ